LKVESFSKRTCGVSYNEEMEAFIWTEEEAKQKGSIQLGPSDCGSCAGRFYSFLNHKIQSTMFLSHLGIHISKKRSSNTPPVSYAWKLFTVLVRSRNYEAPLYEYLLSRVHAGTIHEVSWFEIIFNLRKGPHTIGREDNRRTSGRKILWFFFWRCGYWFGNVVEGLDSMG
jgi:hypothetical protein